MNVLHWVIFLLLFPLPVYIISFAQSFMHKVRVGSLNINGGQDRQKRAVISEMVTQKRLDIVFLQEMHSDKENEIDCGLWWKVQYILSHGTNLSVGVATRV